MMDFFQEKNMKNMFLKANINCVYNNLTIGQQFLYQK